MKKLIFLSLLFLFSISANAQNSELTLEKSVKAHTDIDEVYGQFSDAYRTLDVEKIANLYTESATYLAPDNDILQGRKAIRPTFVSFFDYIKNEERTMTISFQIFQRKVEKNLAYDVGVYTIRQYKDGKEAGTGKGKFVTVVVKEKDGKWRFQVDGYSGLKPPENK